MCVCVFLSIEIWKKPSSRPLLNIKFLEKMVFVYCTNIVTITTIKIVTLHVSKYQWSWSLYPFSTLNFSSYSDEYCSWRSWETFPGWRCRSYLCWLHSSHCVRGHLCHPVLLVDGSVLRTRERLPDWRAWTPRRSFYKA